MLAEAEPDYDEPYDLRPLVVSGGRPFILITVVEPEIGGVQVEHHGLNADVDLPLALQEIALLLAEEEG